MDIKGKPYQRAPQVLALLADHGQLSARTIKILLNPSIEARRLNDVLHRLFTNGLICKQYDGLFGNTGVYYHLSKNTVALKQIAKILLLKPEEINPPNIRHSELMHSQYCTIWTEKLKQLHPDQKVLIEHKFWNDESYGSHYKLDDLSSHIEQRPARGRAFYFILLANSKINRVNRGEPYFLIGIDRNSTDIFLSPGS